MFNNKLKQSSIPTGYSRNITVKLTRKEKRRCEIPRETLAQLCCTTFEFLPQIYLFSTEVVNEKLTHPRAGRY